MARRAVSVKAAVQPPQVRAIGGGLEGAERTDRATATWVPPMRSPDQVINVAKPMADARGRDVVANDGYALNGTQIHKDSIVGSEYRLNLQPNWRALQQITGVAAYDEVWAEEFQTAVEAWFNLLANSPASWLDASRRNTFTGLVRLAVGGFTMTGEVLATAEWIKELSRPLWTAAQMVSPDRLSNPNGLSDSRNLRRGVEMDLYGRPIAYHIRMAHPSENYDPLASQWKRVPAQLRWGRAQVIHIVEQMHPAQTRGVADMVAALKQMRMTKQFQDITLQQAVVNASFAAAIESELPSEAVAAMIGNVPTTDSTNAYQQVTAAYLSDLAAYLGGSKNIQIDGVKIPHLYPGTKLNLRTLGTPGGVGTDFEKSLLRHICAALGVSYEEFSKDYSATSYSSARASMTNTWKFMQARKAQVADRFATAIFTLVLEEMMSDGVFPLPLSGDKNHFWLPLAREAFCNCAWIGASRGQIDELKETQAAILRIQSGLSTYEKECARLGDDFRDVFQQRVREQKAMEKLGLKVDLSATRSMNGNQQDQQNGQDQGQQQ